MILNLIFVSSFFCEFSTNIRNNCTKMSINKMLSYRRETALQGVLQFSPKVEDWNWETIFCGHYRSIFNHNRPENLSNCVKKRKIRAITAFKVIEVGTNRKPVCDFLLVINSN